jgi:sugar phosphate isomerase/epimerase
LREAAIAAAVPSIAQAAPSRAAAPSVNPGSRPVRLGGPVYVESDDPAVLARAHRDLGYRAAYAPKITISDTDRIKATIREYAALDLAIAEVGGWCNMLDPDPEKRRKNLAYVTGQVALADELGARCCPNIAGSFNPDVWYGPHPDNLSRRFFDATVENVRHILDAVKPRRTKFTIEMMGWSIPSGPDEYVELIKAVDRPGFAVHLDVCNVMNSPYRIYNNSDVIGECFAKLGPWIKSCHAKDLAWEVELQVHFREVIPGRGVIDYKRYLTELSRLGTDAPLMLEHLKNAGEFTEGRRYIQGVARSAGVSLGAENG